MAPSFEDSADLSEAWRKNREEGGTGYTYARTGYPELTAREKEIAEMIGTPDTALFNAGMAAITTTIEAQNLHPGDVVLYGKEMYGKTTVLVNALKERGVHVISVDSGDMGEIAEKIAAERPRLIILEAVANAATMRVCDVSKLAELAEGANNRYRSEYSPSSLLEKYLASREYAEYVSPEKREEIIEELAEFRESSNVMVLRGTVHTFEKIPGFSREEAVRETARLAKFVLKSERDSLTIILDNTLSSPVLRKPLDEAGTRDATIIVVESGTKHFQEGKDAITLGVAYANNEAAVERIKAKRTEMGTYLQPNDEMLLPEQLAEKVRGTVELQATHALTLATLLEGMPGVLEVSHPNLPAHEDAELARELAPEGLVTIFYIKVADPKGFVDCIKKMAGDAIEIGTSFGHEKTRLVPEPMKGNVRIAAGAEDEVAFAQLVGNFKAALLTNN
jgi:cystathionine beta-lyase/cystathionine gamma-synthase